MAALTAELADARALADAAAGDRARLDALQVPRCPAFPAQGYPVVEQALRPGLLAKQQPGALQLAVVVPCAACDAWPPADPRAQTPDAAHPACRRTRLRQALPGRTSAPRWRPLCGRP